MAIIETNRLTKYFGSTIALQDVSFSAEAGSLVLITGPNGAGKSTLLKILAGLVLPTSGHAVLDGSRAGSKRLSAAIGYAAGERPGFYDRLTGRQNLEFFASLYGLHGKSARSRIEVLLEDFDACGDKPYQECSVGMKQRLLLARTLLHEPKILLLDEPARSLDAEYRIGLYQKLSREFCRNRGKTVLAVTHQAEEIQRYADRVIEMEEGVVRIFSNKEPVSSA